MDLREEENQILHKVNFEFVELICDNRWLDN